MTALGYDIAPSRPVEPYADMYRAAVLLRPTSGTDEYTVWAATTGSLSTVESAAFEIAGDPAFVVSAAGSLAVAPTFTDGTDTLFVSDPGGRDLSSISTLILIRGDNSASVTSVFASQDPLTGQVVLNGATLTLLDGGFSVDRGDRVASVSYILSGPRFWWSRNDAETTRFGWDGKLGRWAPFKGSPPQNLGLVSAAEESYELAPPVSRFSVGETLPGIPGTPDAFALLRAGIFPDSTAIPLNVRVVIDLDTTGAYPPAGAGFDAVVGVTNGVVLLNPTYVATNAGLTLWYNSESFRPEAVGDLGSLGDLATDSNRGSPVLSPIPGPTERPFIRLGFRRHLTPIPVDTDADLPIPSGVTERTFAWSRSTGKIVLSDEDIKKAQPAEPEYDIAFLEAHVFYDGVALNSQPVPVKTPVAAVDLAGDDLIGTAAGGSGIPLAGALHLRRSSPLPAPGRSGVLWDPDRTGETPNTSSSPEPRPSGSGLVRRISGIGDSFLFSSSFAFENLEVREYDEDITQLRIKISKVTGETTRMVAPVQPAGYTDVSRLEIKRRGLVGDPLFFVQAQVTPSVYSEEARLYARFSGDYVLVGTELLRFAVDGVVYTWNAATNLGAGTFTAAAVAADLDTFITGTGSAVVVRGRVAIQAGVLATGTVEIGWNADPDDLSGHAVLGFLPGWRVDASDTVFRWQPDNGACVGLFRSPDNLDRTGYTADIKAVAAFEEEVLTDNLPGIPFVHLTNPPLEDLPGFDNGVHFTTSLGLNLIRLSNYGVTQGIGVKYDFINDRLIWTERGNLANVAIPSPVETLQLPNPEVLPETVSSLAMAPNGTGYGLYLKEAGAISFTELALEDDFVMPGDGAPGQAVLISPEGGLISSGGGGTFTGGTGTFTNPSLSPNAAEDLILQTALLAAVNTGFLLQILNGDAAGVYTITGEALVGNDAEFTVSPVFPATGTRVSWRILEAQTSSVYDPTLVADIQLVPFNHLPEEPWKIRLLSSVGVVGTPPLTAIVADALASSRITRIRFGLAQSPSFEVPISYLVRGQGLGTLASSGMTIPDLTDPHFTESVPGTAFFQLRVGAEVFSTGLGTLAIVAAFSGPPPAGTIEVGQDGSGIAGEIEFASDILTAQASEQVYFDQLFRTALPAGQSEVDPTSGDVNLSAADAATYTGQTAYFVEQMITEASRDVTISPINGAILFNKPLRAFQLVETEYFQADSNGNAIPAATPLLIVEYLPLTVRLEDATRVDGLTYTFNPTGRTLSDVVEEFIWVDVELQNFAGARQAVVAASTITFVTPVDIADSVRINYGVLEAFGGEQTYTVSSYPVYRKPFFLTALQDTFTLDTDRTADISVGQLMVLGPVPVYVKAVSYSAGPDATKVEIWPPPLVEAGSRAPGKDSGFGLSSGPVAITVDPDGTPVAGGGATGFLLTVSASFLAADKGQLEFVFVGDLTQFTQAGHLLEVKGYPHIIIGSALSDDGRYTVVQVANPLYRGFSPPDTVRISARPVYTPTPVEFAGVSAFLDSEDFFLFILGSVDGAGSELPGRQLVEGVHFEVDPGTGDVAFKSPNQAPLQAGERLVAAYTALRQVQPLVSEDAVLSPLYRGRYLFTTIPSESNRILGSTLTAKYTYSSPDTFYFETLLLTDYLAEVAEVALSKSSDSFSGGPVNAYPGVTDNSEQGALGLRGNVRNLKDQDRAARAFIELYNGVILAFEQILEAIDGRMIGDRDGKFRFFVGRDKQYAPPGFEDPVSGDLNTRLVWREIIDEWAGPALLNGYYDETDPAFDPVTAVEISPATRPGETDGLTPNPNVLSFFSDLQRFRVKNDMDDRLLIGFGRPVGFAALFPTIDIPGLFKDMWEAHVFSRLFPEKTRHFSRLFPGLEAVLGATGFTDPGYYTPGRKITVDGPGPGETTEQIAHTLGTSIGKVANASRGEITGVVDITARERLPRARIWRYYPEGDADLDTVLGFPGLTVGKATIVATPLSLSQFPIDAATGFPDPTLLLSGGGGLEDLNTGDSALSTPSFELGQRLRFGTPEGVQGTTYELTDATLNGVFVGGILGGCVLTLADFTGADLAGSEVFVNGFTPLEEVVSAGTGRGDTIYVGPTVPELASIPAGAAAPTLDETAALIQALPNYRLQADVRVGKRTGDFIDSTLPTTDDVFPLPLQDLFGQRPPLPLSTIEGDVEFVNVDRVPFQVPALRGLPTDDAGDVQIPYLQGSNTELSILAEVAAQFQTLLSSDTAVAMPYSPTGGGPTEDQVWEAIFPDEVAIADGEIYELRTIGPNRDPATLYSARDLTPVLTAGVYTADSAIGDVRPFDLLLVEADQPQEVAGELDTGMTGILTVGDASGFAVNGTYSKAEPPRWVSVHDRGDVARYLVENAFGYLDGTFPATAGLLITSALAGTWTALIDLSSVPGLVLDDGIGSLTGGIMGLTSVGPGNAIVIRFYDPDPGAGPGASFLGAIVINATAGPSLVYTFSPPGPATTHLLAGAGVTLSASNVLSIETTTDILTGLPLVASGPFYDFTISVDTFLMPSTNALSGLGVGSAPGSTSCEISRDRLTFNERVSFAHALPRNSIPANADAIELGVQVQIIESTVGAVAGCTVNSPGEVNGGQPFTLMERVGPDPDATVPAGTPYTGTFAPAATGSENGKLRVMAWEGHGNVALPFAVTPTTGLLAAGIPSSDLNATTTILDGTGTIYDADPPAGSTLDGTRHWVDNITATLGAIANAERGDILVVDGSDVAGKGAVATGTYLVRHPVATNAVSSTGEPILGVVLSSDAGGQGDLDMSFPRVLSQTPTTILVQDVAPVMYSPTNCGFPDPAAGVVYLYLVLKDQYASYTAGPPTYVVDADAVYRMAYTIVTYNGTTEVATFTMNAGTAEDAAGAVITDAAFFAAASLGTRVSGMHFIPITPRTSTGLQPNNILGWSSSPTAVALTAGILEAIAGNQNIANHGGAGGVVVTSKAWDKGAAITDIERLFLVGDTTTAGSLGVRVPVPEDSTDFYPDRAAVVYGRQYVTGSNPEDSVRGVASHLALDGVAVLDWRAIHFEDAVAVVPPQVLECLLPGDRLVIGNSLDLSVATVGFYALSGLFLEPSFPRPTTDLNLAFPHVVSANHPLTGLTAQVTHRDFSDFDTSGGGLLEEDVHFYVRRIRRFHEAQTAIANNVELLKFTYELRRGDFSTYTAATRIFTAGLATFGEATNVGPFNDPAVNINSGDVLRVLDVSGTLIDTAEIQRVLSATTLLLRKPGLTAALGAAVSFEIYLDQAIVPHEQSNEQLLELVTDSVVVNRVVNYGLGDTDGGEIPTTFNTMQDSLIASWTAEGVQEGDYVVVDPAGVLYDLDEEGARPIGDVAVAGRAPFVAGGPSALDDNRGFYRVVTDPATTGANLEVSGTTDRFGDGSQDGSAPLILGGAGAEYAVLPTIGGSTLTSTDPAFPFGGNEGQSALRPTAAPVGTSYRDRVGFSAVKSLQPFGYRIIRPSSIFSRDAVEFILFTRERMLSWIEEIRGIYDNGRGGDYYVFQEDDHIDDVGNPTDPLDGLGILSNVVIESLRGLVATTPFANTSDCLSVLDRRFWILDFRLDADGYTDFVTDSFGQRPVEVDLIEDVLDLDDRFRELRFSWIRFRADHVDGSITVARRAEDQLPDELQKQKELIAQRAALSDT